MKSILLLTAVFFSTLLYSQEFYLKGTCVSGNCKNGTGKYVYENGTYYEGKFKKGKFEGMGTEIFADGTKVTGEFEDGAQMGQAKVIRADGNIWEGKCIYNNPNGNGTMLYLNGNTYTGFMNRWCEKSGEGQLTLSNGYSIKGTFSENKPVHVVYLDAENKTITKEQYESKERSIVEDSKENLSRQHETKLQDYILKNPGVVVQNINIPITKPIDLSAMTYRTSDIDLLFSASKDNLFCIKREKNKPSSYDYPGDQITAFSASSLKRLFSGTFQDFEQSEVGRKMVDRFFNKPAEIPFKLNLSDESVKKIINELNILTAPAGSIEFEIANENYMVFKDVHRNENYSKKTFYFINKKSNLCEKIVTINASIEVFWNDDLTKSCMKYNSQLPENLVPDVYKFGYFSSLYLVDWETFQARLLDDHENQLNFLAYAKKDKLESDISYHNYNAKVAAINRENSEIEKRNDAIQSEKTAHCTCCHGTGQQEIKGMFLGLKTVRVIPINGLGIGHDETVSEYGPSRFVRCSCCR